MNLEGLSNVTELERLNLSELDGLISLAGLEALAQVTSTVQLSTNPALESVTALENLATIGGDLALLSNPALRSLDGLSNLTAVGQQIWIEEMAELASLSGLSALTSVGSLRIMRNPALVSFAGLERLSHVTGGPSGEGLAISGNAALTSVDGLSGLVEIDTYLTLQGNDSLRSLRGFASLQSINGFFSVKNNAVLPTCEAEWLHDRLSGIIDLDEIEGNDDSGVCPP